MLMYLKASLVWFLVWNIVEVRADAPPIIENDIKGVIAAFGDFDSDKMTDVFLIHPTGRSFSVLKGYKAEPLLKVNKKWFCELPQTVPKEETIVSLMLADFHGMALMDVLVVTKDDSNLYSMYLVQGSKDSLSCSQVTSLLSDKMKTQPLLLDVNGDMIADVVVRGTKNESRIVWTFGFNASLRSDLMFGKGEMRDESGAFVDLNGDSVADVYLAGDSNEYWFLGPSGFQEVVLIPRPEYSVIGHSSFVDADSDGKIDHLVPVCRDRYCKSSSIVMLDGKRKWIEIATNFHAESDTDKKYGFYFDSHPALQKLAFPLTLRHADFNGDGYPDFLTLMESSDGGDPFVVALMNVHNIASNSSGLSRTFVAYTLPRPYQAPYRPIVASFFDLYEDGRPDILMSVMNKDNTGDVVVKVIINSVMVDACFLKVMLASGLCYEDCSGVKDPNSTPTFEPGDKDALGIGIPYGTNQPGANLCHELMDTEGFRKVGCQGQLTQSSYFSLQMPYTIFGLGSTPNFVETLNATIPGPNTSFIRSRAWTSIVPDAQVVLIPYPTDYPSQWRSKLYYTPSDIVLSTLITLASICIVLIVVIAFLHRKEILEDIAEHEEYKRHWPDSR